MKIKNKNQNEQIGVLMQDFVTHIVEFYDSLEAKPVCHSIPKETFFSLENQTIPAHGRPIQEVYSEMLEDWSSII